jgi:hypothetical protein
MTNDVQEAAKAVQETAKTAGKAIDASRDLGGFFARIFGGALEETGGIFTDQLKFWRARRGLRLAHRYEEIRAQFQVSGPVTPIGLNVGVPLLEAASLQDDDQIQDMFARLLVNATNPQSKIEARQAFVSILQDFGPLEALLLERLCKAPTEAFLEGTAIMTAKLPDAYSSKGDENTLPSRETQIAIWNLARLGCVEPGGTWGGGSTVSVVTLTELGRALFQACSNPNESSDASANAESPDTNWGLKNFEPPTETV